jgi:hypothetical protein
MMFNGVQISIAARHVLVINCPDLPVPYCILDLDRGIFANKYDGEPGLDAALRQNSNVGWDSDTKRRSNGLTVDQLCGLF